MKLYAKRDTMAQGEHYIRHVSAMTGEGLHAKSAIAAELAHRDMEIERLREELEQARQRADFLVTMTREAQDYATGYGGVCLRQQAELNTLRTLLARYRDETPLGHQPHMIAHEADRALGRGPNVRAKGPATAEQKGTDR